MRASAASRSATRAGRRREPWTTQYRRFSHRDALSYGWDSTSTYIDATSIRGGLTSALSLSMWIKCGTSTPQRMLFAINEANGVNRTLLFWPASTTNLRIYRAADFAAGTQHQTTNTQDDAWHHIAYTWTGSTAILYVDGAKEFTGTNVSGPSATTLLSLGAEYDPGTPPTIGDWFHGSLSQIAVYDRVLTQAEITKAYNGGAAFDERRLGCLHLYMMGDWDKPHLTDGAASLIDRGAGRVHLVPEGFAAGDITEAAP